MWIVISFDIGSHLSRLVMRARTWGRCDLCEEEKVKTLYQLAGECSASEVVEISQRSVHLSLCSKLQDISRKPLNKPAILVTTSVILTTHNVFYSSRRVNLLLAQRH